MLSRRAARVSPATLRHYTYHLGMFLEWCSKNEILSVGDLTQRSVHRYLANQSDTQIRTYTLHGRARTLSTFVGFLFDEGLLPERLQVPKPQLPQRPPPELDSIQIRALLETCDSAQNKAIVLMLVSSGLRKSELLSLDWGDLNFQALTVYVRRGKGARARFSAFGMGTAKALLKYRQEVSHRPDEPVFLSRGGNRVTGNALQSFFLRLSTKSRVHVHAHKLRHTAASWMHRAGMSVFEIQAALGHSDLTMTRRYTNVNAADLSRAVQKADAVDRFLNGSD